LESSRTSPRPRGSSRTILKSLILVFCPWPWGLCPLLHHWCPKIVNGDKRWHIIAFNFTHVGHGFTLALRLFRGLNEVQNHREIFREEQQEEISFPSGTLGLEKMRRKRFWRASRGAISLSRLHEWRRDEFERWGHRSGAKVREGTEPAQSAGKIFWSFPSPFWL